MFFNYNTLIILIAIFVFCVFIYTLYNSIITINKSTSMKYYRSAQWAGLAFSRSNLSLSQFEIYLLKKFGNINISKCLQYSLIGTVSTSVNTTEVFLTDAELMQLVEPLLSEITGNIITVAQLQAFGLYTESVITFLQGLGFIVI